MEIEQVCVKAAQLKEKRGQSVNTKAGIPGIDWVKSFLARWEKNHPELVLHLCRPCFEDRNRSSAMKLENIER